MPQRPGLPRAYLNWWFHHLYHRSRKYSAWWYSGQDFYFFFSWSPRDRVPRSTHHHISFGQSCLFCSGHHGPGPELSCGGGRGHGALRHTHTHTHTHKWCLSLSWKCSHIWRANLPLATASSCSFLVRSCSDTKDECLDVNRCHWALIFKPSSGLLTPTKASCWWVYKCIWMASYLTRKHITTRTVSCVNASFHI